MRPAIAARRACPQPTASHRGGKFLVQTCAQLCDNCVKGAAGGIERAGVGRRTHAGRDGSMRFRARPQRRRPAPACGFDRHADGDYPRAGWANEQFLRHHCSLSDHDHRRAVRHSLFHRLERLSRRVRGGGHAPLGPRGEGRRRGQPAPAADTLFPLREGAHCRHLRQPPGAVFPSRQPHHQAVHAADVPRRDGGQRDRAAAAGAAPCARQHDGWNWQSFGQAAGQAAYLPPTSR